MGMEPGSRDGREALRRLDEEYRPAYKGRQMALLRMIMHPKLTTTTSDMEYLERLSEWQKIVHEYERVTGRELDETVKTATLVEEAPPQMQEHLRLRSEEIGNDYKKVVLAIESYMRSKTSWTPASATVPMDIGAIGKDGGKKGKGKGFLGKGEKASRRARMVARATQRADTTESRKEKEELGR